MSTSRKARATARKEIYMETKIAKATYIIEDINKGAQLVYGSSAERRYVADASISPWALAAELKKMFTEDSADAQRFESLAEAEKAFKAIKPRLTRFAVIKAI